MSAAAVLPDPSREEAEIPSMGLTTFISRVIFGEARQLARPDQIAQRLEEAICVGLILDGERLPTETQLAEEVGAGVSTLRQALAILRTQGLVETRRGRGGGSFVRVARPGGGAELPHEHLLRARLMRFTIVELTQLGDQRRAVSGTAAALAAERALPVEIDALDSRVAQLAAAADPSARRRADTQFGVEVAAAGQSPALAEREMQLRSVLGDLLWWRVPDERVRQRIEVTRALVAAVRAGDAGAARDGAESLIAEQTATLVRAHLAVLREQA